MDNRRRYIMKKIITIIANLLCEKINEALRIENKPEIDFDEYLSVKQDDDVEQIDDKLLSIVNFWNEVETIKFGEIDFDLVYNKVRNKDRVKKRYRDTNNTNIEREKRKNGKKRKHKSNR